VAGCRPYQQQVPNGGPDGMAGWLAGWDRGAATPVTAAGGGGWLAGWQGQASAAMARHGWLAGWLAGRGQRRKKDGWLAGWDGRRPHTPARQHMAGWLAGRDGRGGGAAAAMAGRLGWLVGNKGACRLGGWQARKARAGGLGFRV
jgi:hypothetical protein